MNLEGATVAVAGNMAAFVAVMPLGRAGWFFEPSRLTPHNEGTTMTEAQEAAARALAETFKSERIGREADGSLHASLRLDCLLASGAGGFPNLTTARAYAEFVLFGDRG